MKKKIVSLFLALVLLIAVGPARAEAAQNVSATVASFKVTLNGVVMDNDYAQYPLIVYKDITYFPMTYYDCRFMAVKTDWDNDTRTLSINAAGAGDQYHPTTKNDKNPQKITASVVDYNVFINGKKIDNLSEPYPLLSFRDVTYFPMTWRFCVDEFGWKYSYTQESGLIVDSGKDSASDPKKEALENVIYEDQYLRIQYLGFVVDENAAEYSYNGKLRFKVYNKGLSSVLGKPYTHIWVSAADYGVDGQQWSRTGFFELGAAAAAGESAEFECPFDATDEIIANGIGQLSAAFCIRFGYFNGNEIAFSENGFVVMEETVGFSELVLLNNSTANKNAPKSSGKLIYSDANLDLYFLEHAYTVSYNVHNKTNRPIKLECKSVSVMGEVDTEVGVLFVPYDFKVVMPYSLSYMELAGVPSGDPYTENVGVVFEISVGEKTYKIEVEDPYKPLSSADYTNGADEHKADELL